MKPVNPELFGVSPSRTNLLWALECLAWNPKTLPRVSRILSQLATIEIADNWGNKPIESLKAIFRAWMPQTAASNKERFLMLERISKQYPDIAWQIALDQIQTRFKSGFSSYRPNWRDDAS
ncbi:MAG TPA: addiction module antitoxin, partial [Enterococcus faecalis]|nr:addiction module antitoxin [Enterococcus faecalis]